MIAIHPSKLFGNWFEGFALDLHTVSSELVGYDEYGHEVFKTERSEIGELLYKLKYRSDRTVLGEIVDTVVHFVVAKWKIGQLVDYVVPVPPSNVRRGFQPVLEIAKGIGLGLQVPVIEDYLTKIKETPELKDVYAHDERLKLLNDAFSINSPMAKGKNVLLFDDLYRSGATLRATTDVLYKRGKISHVYVLALTKTRIKS